MKHKDDRGGLSGPNAPLAPAGIASAFAEKLSDESGEKADACRKLIRAKGRRDSDLLATPLETASRCVIFLKDQLRIFCLIRAKRIPAAWRFFRPLDA